MPCSVNSSNPSSSGFYLAGNKSFTGICKFPRGWSFCQWSCQTVLYGTKETPPVIYSSRLGHTSLMVCLFFIWHAFQQYQCPGGYAGNGSYIFICRARSQLFNFLFPIHPVREFANRVCSHWPQKGEFCISTALRSPNCISSFTGWSGGCRPPPVLCL